MSGERCYRQAPGIIPKTLLQTLRRNVKILYGVINGGSIRNITFEKVNHFLTILILELLCTEVINHMFRTNRF